MNQTYHLELLFKDAEGKSRKITIRNPQTNLTPETARAALDAVVESQAFYTDKGVPAFVEAVGARYIARNVEELYLFEDVAA